VPLLPAKIRSVAIADLAGLKGTQCENMYKRGVKNRERHHLRTESHASKAKGLFEKPVQLTAVSVPSQEHRSLGFNGGGDNQRDSCSHTALQ
jgi:hypothetical protein